MKNLPLGLRVFLNALVFSVPIVVLTYLMYQSQDINIQFARKELIGNKLQKPFEEVLHWTEISKLSDLWKVDIDGKQNLEPSLVELTNILQEVGETLQFTKEGLASRKRENAKIENIKSLIHEKKWDDAINSIKAGIAQLGDTSNLVLDPDLDSYYLMDISLLALPQMQDRIHAILADRAKFFSGEKMTEQLRIQAALYAAQLNDSDLQRIIGDSQTSLNEDKNFFGLSPSLQENLPKTVGELNLKTTEFISMLKKISNGEVVEEKEFIKLGLSLLQQSYLSWSVASSELETLLKNRMQKLESERSTSLTWAGISLLFAVLFSILVGVSFSQSIRGILESVLKLKSLSGSTVEVGSKLSQASKEVSDSATSQAAAIEETAASVEEINSMVSLTAENSKHAADLAQSTNKSATSAESEISTMLASMEEISESSKKIVDAIAVIDDIAFQTNLLALNASVEAARAGEQGRGFAVVAEAVRALALKSASAAKEIDVLVQANVEIIQSGRSGASKSGDSMKQIIGFVKKLNILIEDIAKAAHEQNTGMGQISKAISALEVQAINNQQSISAVSESADDLLNNSNGLNKVITSLEKEVLGASKAKADVEAS